MIVTYNGRVENAAERFEQNIGRVIYPTDKTIIGISREESEYDP